ncbi:unnamed protein product [Calypogeia fissa]
MKPSRGPAIVPEECFKHFLDAKAAMLALRQISQQPLEETKPWTSLTKEQQRELQLLANSARLQVQKSVRDLTSEIRQLRQALDTSQWNGEGLESVERVVAQTWSIPTESQRSGPPGSHRQRLAAEAWHATTSASKAEEEPNNVIPASSNSVAKQSGQSKRGCPVFGHSVARSPAKELSALQRDKTGRSKRVEGVGKSQTMRESAVARKCEACRGETESGNVGEPRKRHSSNNQQCLSYPERMDVKSSSGPWTHVSRKQNQGSNLIITPAKSWETYLHKRGRKEIQEQDQHSRQESLERSLHKDTEHPRTEKPSRHLHRRMEKKFVEAVENYFVKLMSYEEKVLQRWFSPTGEWQSLETEGKWPSLERKGKWQSLETEGTWPSLERKGKWQSLEREQLPTSEVPNCEEDSFSPDQSHWLKERNVPLAPNVRKLKVQLESSIPISSKSFKQGRLSSGKVKCLREQQNCNEGGNHRTRIPAHWLRGDEKLDVPTIKRTDYQEPRHLKVEAVEHSECDKKTRVTLSIAEILLDEALAQVAGELRTWCGKVVDHLIDTELGTNIL